MFHTFYFVFATKQIRNYRIWTSMILTFHVSKPYIRQSSLCRGLLTNNLEWKERDNNWFRSSSLLWSRSLEPVSILTSYVFPRQHGKWWMREKRSNGMKKNEKKGQMKNIEIFELGRKNWSNSSQFNCIWLNFKQKRVCYAFLLSSI